MHACMCISICLFVRMSAHACTHVRMSYICACMYMYVCMHACMYLCPWVSLSVSVCLSACLSNVCVSVCMYVHTFRYLLSIYLFICPCTDQLICLSTDTVFTCVVNHKLPHGGRLCPSKRTLTSTLPRLPHERGFVLELKACCLFACSVWKRLKLQFWTHASRAYGLRLLGWK